MMMRKPKSPTIRFCLRSMVLTPPWTTSTAFNNTNAHGTWTLKVLDNDPSNDPDEWTYAQDGWRFLNEDGGRVMDWSIDFVRQPDVSNETPGKHHH